MNHPMRTHISNKNLGQIVTSSLSPTGVAKAFVGTADNQPKLACFPVDLNVKGRAIELLYYQLTLLTITR